MGCRARQLAAVVAATIWLGVAAPAGAATPVASDFEQRLRGVEQVQAKGGGPSDEGPVTHRSGVIVAPATFDAVGIAGEMRHVEFRARHADGEWTDWIEVANGDPLYVVGGADESQLRTRGWRPWGRLHYVDVAEPAATAKRSRNKGELPRPRMISRRAWGAEGACEPRTRPSYGKVKAIAVHHTVTSNTYSRSESKGIVLAICRYHRNGNGWNDIGYNALVDRFGRLFEGREGGRWRPVVGAHAQGYNSQSAGIAVIGNHSDVGPPRQVMGGLARYLAYRLERLGFRAGGRTTLTSGGGDVNRYPAGAKVRVGRIFRHRDVGITACPGGALAGKIEALRRKTAKRMAR